MCRNRLTDVATPDSPDSPAPNSPEGVTGNPAQRPRDKVFLIGFSATGKSHSGRLAAQALGAPFIDMDRLIANRTGKQIAEIFEVDGEEEFRRIERELLREVAQSSGRRVISTGGGIPVDGRNRDVMARSGITIRLMASPETIHARLNRNRAGRSRREMRRPRRRAAIRPMLPGSESKEAGIERIRELLTEREEAYAAAADVTIDTEGREPPDVASEIVSLIRGAAQKSEAKE